MAENIDNLISRQAAIEAVQNRHIMLNKEKVLLINDLEKLPSPEPQIIRCKDCKHHWTYKCMDSMPIERCDLEQTFYDAERDFCSLAERRTE